MDEKLFRKFANENFIPIVREKTSKLLIEKIKEINPKNILEVGTAIGYSGILMLENSKAKLTTLEKSEEMKDLALQNFINEGLIERVSLILGDAKDYIKTEPEKFDFIFLDGPKSHYLEYLPHLLRMLNKNGLLFCDNVLFQGMVRSEKEPPKKFRTIINNLRKFLFEIENDNKLLTQIIDLEDGIAIITKKEC